MSYSLTTIWHERSRFLPAILAVAFSAILIAVQCGLMIGLLSMISAPVDKSAADIWAGYPGIRSVDLGRPLPDRWVNRIAAQPEIERAESCLLGFSLWTSLPKSNLQATPEICTIVGTRLDAGAVGPVEPLRVDPELRLRLNEPFSVIVDRGEVGRLGLTGRIGEYAEILGRRVKVVGFVEGFKSVGGPYVFCSEETARPLMRYGSGEVTYLLGRCRNPVDAERVAQRLRQYPNMSVFTAEEFSWKTRMHWLFTTKAGVAVGFTAMLGLLVGAVVTSQTLYAATAAMQRELATLRAMGIPRWRLQFQILAQSLWVGVLGILVAGPITFLIAEAANRLGTQVQLHPIILGLASGITILMAVGSGLAALRSFQRVDPAHNIR